MHVICFPANKEAFSSNDTIGSALSCDSGHTVDFKVAMLSDLVGWLLCSLIWLLCSDLVAMLSDLVAMRSDLMGFCGPVSAACWQRHDGAADLCHRLPVLPA